jgi:TetR/AcrR family transcriptional regulator, tetracycline repressor protein
MNTSMGRPRKPLISRRKTLEAALRIIDDEGLNALNIRRLGKELKVQGISLYNHFEDKDAILVGACELALADVRTPNTSNKNWREWLTAIAIEYWRALRKHPNLIPILTRRHPLRIGLSEHNAAAGLLAVQGVPPGVIMPLFESLEAVALGFGIYQAAVETDEQTDNWEAQYPSLFHVSQNRALPTSRVFEVVAQAAVEAVMKAFEATAGDTAPSAPDASAMGLSSSDERAPGEPVAAPRPRAKTARP